MTLAATQADFSKWLRFEDKDAAIRLGADTAPGLAVYLNTYRAQLMTCLKESFPQTVKWLGEAAFHQAAACHIDNVPPSSWTLDAYPARFPQTLAALYPNDLEVAELARLELALSEAFCAADARAIQPEDVATIDWDRTLLRLTPGTQILLLSTNAPAIWSAMSRDHADAPAVRLETASTIVWRSDLRCHFRTAEADEAVILMGLHEGESLERICEELTASQGSDRAIARAGTLLAQWAGDGFLRFP